MSTQLEENGSMADFLDAHAITMDLQEVPENPSMENSRDTMINYFVILKHEDRMMTLYFSTGLGWVEKRCRVPKVQERSGYTWQSASMVSYDKKHKCFIRTEWGGKRHNADDGNGQFSNFRIKKPTVADVLDCLASDASGADQGFEDWAGDLGYDTDSRKAEETYKTIQRQTKELRKLIGGAAFDALLYRALPTK